MKVTDLQISSVMWLKMFSASIVGKIADSNRTILWD